MNTAVDELNEPVELEDVTPAPPVERTLVAKIREIDAAIEVNAKKVSQSRAEQGRLEADCQKYLGIESEAAAVYLDKPVSHNRNKLESARLDTIKANRALAEFTDKTSAWRSDSAKLAAKREPMAKELIKLRRSGAKGSLQAEYDQTQDEVRLALVRLMAIHCQLIGIKPGQLDLAKALRYQFLGIHQQIIDEHMLIETRLEEV